jgi:hypothetical protein
VQSGDTCDGVVTKYGNFTLSQFYRYAHISLFLPLRSLPNGHD